MREHAGGRTKCRSATISTKARTTQLDRINDEFKFLCFNFLQWGNFYTRSLINNLGRKSFGVVLSKTPTHEAPVGKDEYFALLVFWAPFWNPPRFVERL
jgi:hypothetical protein